MIRTSWKLKIDEILKLGRIVDKDGNMIVSSTNIKVLKHIIKCVNDKESKELLKQFAQD